MIPSTPAYTVELRPVFRDGYLNVPQRAERDAWQENAALLGGMFVAIIGLWLLWLCF
jgi:hypothetical protein